MNSQSRQPPEGAVVVGIGTNGWQSATRWAVQECLLRQAPLHLVHTSGPTGAFLTRASKIEVAEQAEKLVHDAADYARKRGDGQVEVSTEIDSEHAPVEGLVRASAQAQLVVLQHRDIGLVRRAVAGSVVNGVAARSLAPVVSVADRWRPGKGSNGVAVAIQHPADALALLHAGGAAARARDTAVLVLHAWWLDSGYDNVAVDDAFRQRHQDETRAWLDPAIALFHEDHPDVPVAITVRHAPPLEAILEAAAGSGLLVVGRRHHLLPQGSHLGPVSRAVLDHVDTPVLVIGKPTTESS